MYRRVFLAVCGLGFLLAGCTGSTDTEVSPDQTVAQPASGATAADPVTEGTGSKAVADADYVRVVLNVSGMT